MARTASTLTALVALMGACVATGCGDKDTAEPVDTGFCADVPLLTWENFGSGFMVQECQACHATDSPSRNGAPEAVSFDTEARVWEQATQILGVATGEAPYMPPEGGIPEDDRYKLEVWLRCGVPGGEAAPGC